MDGVLPNTIHREGLEVLITLPWRDEWDRVASMRKFAEIEYSAVNTVMRAPRFEAVTINRKNGNRPSIRLPGMSRSMLKS